ncbi:hypothetical protein C8R44DRAFT_771089 [Mycena epipterygia]|nr:hypothetical protein C8R44DRAFT_771089 [Mycena epipterygia]
MASGIQQIAPEILAEIFIFCLDNINTFELNTRDAPWVLGEICTCWRTTALSTPRLWRSIALHFSEANPYFWSVRRPSPCSLTRLVRLFLERSGVCPFDVHLSSEKNLNSPPALAMLMKESHRWADVRIDLPVAMILDLAPVKGRVQSLHTLTVSASRARFDECPVFDAFEEARVLRDLSLYEPHAIQVVAPWAQLVSYHGQYGHLRTVLDALRAMPNLAVCNLCYIEPDEQDDDDDDVESAPILLLHMRELTITHEGWPSDDHFSRLLDNLTVPRLERLEIECSDYAVFPHLTALVTRSGCALRTFSLQKGIIIHVEILAFLAQVPTLTKLSLSCTDLTIDATVGLTRTAGADLCPLPVLRELRIEGELPAAEFASMIESRVGPDEGCLQVLEITTPTLESQLSSMRDRGLRLTLVEAANL